MSPDATQTKGTLECTIVVSSLIFKPHKLVHWGVKVQILKTVFSSVTGDSFSGRSGNIYKVY